MGHFVVGSVTTDCYFMMSPMVVFLVLVWDILWPQSNLNVIWWCCRWCVLVVVMMDSFICVIWFMGIY